MMQQVRPFSFPYRGIVCLLALSWTGCAAITNPVADGIPVRRLPDEMIRPSPREDLKPVPLTALRQKPADTYLLAKGDILGIIIESVLGDRNQAAPVRLGDVPGQTPAQGFPIPVQEDGTIRLPYIDPLNVTDKNLVEVEESLVKAYTEDKKLLKVGTERILVTLLKPRTVTVLIVREDGGTSGVSAGPQYGQNGTIIGSSKRGSGYTLELPAYENDVLNALARTGGLPGTDAKTEVVIYHKKPKTKPNGELVTITRIPLRIRDSEALPFNSDDIVLNEGDILYLESREAEVFYTAGLLGSGQFPLPRDYDLDVMQAIALVRGPLANGGFSQNQFVGQSVTSGLGSPSPSLVTILRKMPNRHQVQIRVDLNRALRDPRERVLIQPGDFLVLQEKPAEAFARYITQTLRLNLFTQILNGGTGDATITGTGTGP
jgi:protein involved in polysaccharide export with SLBB domain